MRTDELIAWWRSKGATVSFPDENGVIIRLYGHVASGRGSTKNGALMDLTLRLLFALWRGWGPNGDRWYVAGSAWLFILFLLIGLKLFGFPIHE